jgi:hypothetical protein
MAGIGRLVYATWRYDGKRAEGAELGREVGHHSGRRLRDREGVGPERDLGGVGIPIGQRLG